MKWLLLLCCLFFGCTKKQGEITSWQGIFFDIPFELHIAEPLSYTQKKQIEALLTAEFTAIDTQCNHWNPDSELSILNKKLGHPHTLSPLLRSLFRVAEEAFKETEGWYDPSLHASIMAAKSSLKAGMLPPKNTRVHTFTSVRHGSANVVTTQTTLDFDGILKGFAIDRLVNALRSRGYTHFLINWSGEVYAAGRHISGRKWRISLPALNRDIELENEALASSGSQEQVWDVDGNQYTHLVHPKTGVPMQADIPLAVSVVAPSCAKADAYATAILCGMPISNNKYYKIYKN